jgi:hypothetical protein
MNDPSRFGSELTDSFVARTSVFERAAQLMDAHERDQSR